MPEIGAIILAGGQATRMGGEKALRVLRGKTLLEHAVEICRNLSGRIVIAVGPRKIAVPQGAIAVSDAAEHANCGPLAGIAAGMRALGKGRAVVLACDLPNIPAALLKRLAAQAEPVAFCEHGGQPEPLVCALDVATMLPKVRDVLATRQLKVVPLWKNNGAKILRDADLTEFAPLERTFANVNTLQELEGEQRRSQ
ncbi:MAG: molybdenum cofactor guanylyltransferase [Planctomycetes bacterium]|nr:molybdenum cofactor guanylyltransferase [Planctomycetota bacterium]